MICNVTLTDQMKNQVNLVLSDSLNSSIDNAQKCIYQDLKYSTKIKMDIDVSDAQIELYVNNKNIQNFENSNRIFSTLFGYAQITIAITFPNEETKILSSEYLIVAVDKNNNSEQSIKDMLTDIYNKNQSLLYYTTSKQFSLNSHEISKSQYKTLDSEIHCLHDIYTTYSKNLSAFKNNHKYKLVPTNKVDDFDKVKKITPSVLQYIQAHPEQLCISDSTSGIKIGKSFFSPIKSLVEFNVKNTEIYENKVVIGFLSYIISEINKKEKTICELHMSSKYKNIEHRDGYKLSTVIIRQLTEYRVMMYKDKLVDIKKAFIQLYNQYVKILGYNEIRINRQPKPTKIFLSIHHYREIFTIIKEWFVYGDYQLQQEKALMNFITADQIYEYYSLICMLEVFQNIGFDYVISPRNINYQEPDHRYIKTMINNEYVIKQNNLSITLYYQPVIYSNLNKAKKYPLELFRVDSDYYAPDFVLKFEMNKNIHYVILDSKWSNRYTIKKYEIADVLFKYGIGIRTICNITQQNNIWILQGKDDKKNKLELYHKVAINNSQQDSYKYQYGIVTLTPKSGIDNLRLLLTKFIDMYNDE